MTKLYKITPNDKILELLNVVDIMDELRLLNESYSLEKCKRKGFKNEERNKILKSNKKSYYNEYRNLIDSSISRYTLWCMTEIGPFKSTLLKMNLVSNDLCRYCCSDIENIEHLYFYCKKFNKEIDKSEKIIEKKCIYIIKTLMKDKNLIKSYCKFISNVNIAYPFHIYKIFLTIAENFKS